MMVLIELLMRGKDNINKKVKQLKVKEERGGLWFHEKTSEYGL